MNMVTNKMGMKDFRYGRWTIICFVLWTILTSMVCF